jgi:hypothetical protein
MTVERLVELLRLAQQVTGPDSQVRIEGGYRLKTVQYAKTMP